MAEFTLKSIFTLTKLLNANKLDFDTRFTDDEWGVLQVDSMMNRVRISNVNIGEFTFKRVNNSQKYELVLSSQKTCASRFWANLRKIIISFIKEPVSLNYL